MPGALYVNGHSALVLCAVACYPSWQDFASFGNKFAQLTDFFIVNGCNLIGTEVADALFTAPPSFLDHIKTSFLVLY